MPKQLHEMQSGDTVQVNLVRNNRETQKMRKLGAEIKQSLTKRLVGFTDHNIEVIKRNYR